MACVYVATSVFDGASVEDVDEALVQWQEQNEERGVDLGIDKRERAASGAEGTMQLETGALRRAYEGKVMVGYMYILKLLDLVDDKIQALFLDWLLHLLVTAAAAAGKVSSAASASARRRSGRWRPTARPTPCRRCSRSSLRTRSAWVKAYEVIVRRRSIPEPSIPELFKVLSKEIESLSLMLTSFLKAATSRSPRRTNDLLKRPRSWHDPDRVRADSSNGAADEKEEQVVAEGEAAVTETEAGLRPTGPRPRPKKRRRWRTR